MSRLKRPLEIVLIFVIFPIAVFGLVLIAIGVSLKGLAVYVGTLLTIWLLFAWVLPLGTGIMKFDEIVAGIRHQRRSRTRFEGEPLRSDRALWMHWNRGERH